MYALRITLITCMICFMCFPGKGLTANRMNTCKKEAINLIETNHRKFEKAALAIYEFAETSLEEYKSSEYLADMLEQGGFTVERGTADMPTAFIAVYGSGKPVVGILAEYDALPGLSQKQALTSKEAIEKGDPGHGCGHNLFGAASTAAALAIKAVMEKHNLSGTVKLFGCPAEETGIGKVYMAKAGVFDGLDACFSWHPGTKNEVRLGSNNAVNSFEIIFRGKTAHAAADPHNGRSALDAVELMNAGVNFLREHVKDSVRIHYVIKDGGEAPNIVPDYTRVWYFVRDINRKGVEEVYARVLKCAEGAVIMTETTMEVNLITGVYNYLPNNTLSLVMHENFLMVGPPEFTEEEQAFAKEMQKNLGISQDGVSTKIEELKKPEKIARASTDVSDVTWIVPTSGELTVVTAPLEIPWHSWAVCSSSSSSIGLKGMNTAAKVLAASSIEVLMDKNIVEKARKEFDKKTDGFIYKSALTDGQKPQVPSSQR